MIYFENIHQSSTFMPLQGLYIIFFIFYIKVIVGDYDFNLKVKTFFNINKIIKWKLM